MSLVTIYDVETLTKLTYPTNTLGTRPDLKCRQKLTRILHNELLCPWVVVYTDILVFRRGGGSYLLTQFLSKPEGLLPPLILN